MNLVKKEKTVFILVLLISLVMTVTIFSFDPIAQPIVYHNFADQNSYLNIPNFFDFISNLPFIVVGVLGLYHLKRAHCQILSTMRVAYYIFFIGVTLVGFGSAYYHFWPDNVTLVWDRLPMTIAFMALFSFVIGEFISQKIAHKLLYPLLLIGLFSVVYWAWSESHGAGDLRVYILVQFVPMIVMPIILLTFKSSFTHTQGYWFLLLAYLAAKLLEHFDGEVYAFLGVISGHSLKHLAAALGIYLFLLSLKERKLSTL